MMIIENLIFVFIVKEEIQVYMYTNLIKRLWGIIVNIVFLQRQAEK